MTEKPRTAKPSQRSRRRLYRLLLLLLVIVPFWPEIVIWTVSALARLNGCHPAQKDACQIGTVLVSDVIAWALRMSATAVITGVRHAYKWAILGAICAWLVLCYAVVIRAWTHVASRLIIGFVVGVVFAILPPFGPLLAIATLVNDNCRPNEGYIGACTIFGAHVGDPQNSPVHDAVLMGYLAESGAPLAFGIFVLYAVLVIALRVLWRKTPAASQQSWPTK